MLPSATSSPHASNAPFAPSLSTLPDDDPNTTSSPDPGRDSAFSLQDAGRAINSILIPDISWTPDADITTDFDDLPINYVDTIQEEDEPHVMRAQIDTGAFASCTDQLHLLHDYEPFTKARPCPIKLMPATEDSDTVPLGIGYLHVPADNAVGYLKVHTFYHPTLHTRVIDEQDFIRSVGCSSNDYTGETLAKFADSGTFTYHCHHRRSKARGILIHGVLRYGKCYTNELIPPDLNDDHPKANLRNSIDKLASEDPEFASDCERATIYNIFVHQESKYRDLKHEFENLPTDSPLRKLPFHEYIHKYTPIHNIRAKTERLLWHQ